MSNKVIDFAKKQGYKTAEFTTKWKGYDVYEPVFSEELSYIGLPLWILVKGNDIRMTNEKECFEILDFVGSEQEAFDKAFDNILKSKRKAKAEKATNDEMKKSIIEKIRKIFKK